MSAILNSVKIIQVQRDQLFLKPLGFSALCDFFSEMFKNFIKRYPLFYEVFGFKKRLPRFQGRSLGFSALCNF